MKDAAPTKVITRLRWLERLVADIDVGLDDDLRRFACAC
jgi:hypothetical protein